jgi:hypothetical protein
MLVDAFVLPAFGSPADPKPSDHLQGLVAEFLWHMLVTEQTVSGRALRNLDPPSWRTTDPGADGLAVYEMPDGILIFRLWEIKKNVGKAHVSVTIGHASKQLTLRGLEYLAKYTAAGSHSAETDLAVLFGSLPTLWLDDDWRSGLGVAIATSSHKTPTRKSFGGLRTAFPTMAAGHRLEGLLVGIADFPDFALSVRSHVWNGR